MTELIEQFIERCERENFHDSMTQAERWLAWRRRLFAQSEPSWDHWLRAVIVDGELARYRARVGNRQ